MLSRILAWLIAYAFAIASAALASLYGILSADGPYAIAKAAVLCLVAFGGCHGLAYMVKLWRSYGFFAALLAAVATIVCLCVTLLGGLGTMSSGGAEMRAERAKLASDVDRERDRLRSLTRERDALPAARPVAMIAADIETAKANARYRLSGGCDATQITASASQAHCAAFRKLEAELGAASDATRLAGEIAAVSERLERAPPVVEADPQASAFAQLTGLPVATSAALYALLASVALEVMGMVAMLVAHAESHRPQKLEIAAHTTQVATARPVVEVIPPPAREPSTNVVPMRRQVATKPPRRDETFPQFLLARLEQYEGASVPVRDVIAAYRAWCEANQCRPMSMDETAAAIKRLCDSEIFAIEGEGQSVALADVRLLGA